LLSAKKGRGRILPKKAEKKGRIKGRMKGRIFGRIFGRSAFFLLLLLL